MSTITHETKLNNFELFDYIKIPDKEKRALPFISRLSRQCANIISACDKLCEHVNSSRKYINSSLNDLPEFKLKTDGSGLFDEKLKLKFDIIEDSYNLLIDLLNKDALLLHNFNEGIINFDYKNEFIIRDFYNEEKAKFEIIKEPMKIAIGDFISKYIDLGKCVNNFFISNITEQICDSIISVLPDIFDNIYVYKSDIMKLVSYLNSVFSGEKN